MRYNGDSDGQDLVSLCNDLVNTNNLTYPIKEKTRAANKTMRRFWPIIFRVYGGWQFSDSNNTVMDSATTASVANQQDYGVPAEALTVRGIDFLVNGEYKPLKFITEEELRESGYSDESFMQNSTGIPQYVLLRGNSIILYPKPTTNLTAAIRITFDKGSVAFSSTDTTKQPGFAYEFHECVAVGMAYEFAKRNALPNYKILEQDLLRYEQDIAEFYSNRFQAMFPPRIKVADIVQEYT